MMFNMSSPELLEGLKKGPNIIVDGDILLFRGTVGAQHEINWGGDAGIATVHCSLPEVMAYVVNYIKTITDDISEHFNWYGKYNIVLAFTGESNFRKTMYPVYKANRNGRRKPIGYLQAREMLAKKYQCVIEEPLEADDVIGILATTYEHTLIVSGDKDFKTIPGHFYDFLKKTFYKTDIKKADYNVLYQTLLGDRTDNYEGLPKCGPVTAEKILANNCSWAGVRDAYLAKGMSESHALMQARMAFILRASHYNRLTKKIRQWTPQDLSL